MSAELLRRIDAAAKKLRERGGNQHWVDHPPTLDLALYASGELSTEEATWVREHLDGCQACTMLFQDLQNELKAAATQEDAVSIANALLSEYEDTQIIRMTLIQLTETMLREVRRMVSPVGVVSQAISDGLPRSWRVRLGPGIHGVLVENAVTNGNPHPRILIADHYGRVIELAPTPGAMGSLFTLLPEVPDFDSQDVELTNQGFEQGKIAIVSIMPGTPLQ